MAEEKKIISVILPTNRKNSKDELKLIESYREHILSLDKPPTKEFMDLVDKRTSDINHFLDITLRSLENQSNIEVILTHKYPEDAKDLVKDYDIRLIKEKPSIWHNLGNYPTVNNNRNTGIINAKNKILWFLDDYSIFNDRLPKNIVDNEKNGYMTTFRSMRRIRFREDNENLNPTQNRSSFFFGDMISGFNLQSYKDNDEIPYSSTWTYGCTIPLDETLDINGFDEIYDGCFGGTDEDLGLRLQLNKPKYRRLIGNQIIYEFSHPTSRQYGKEKTRDMTMFRKITQQLPVPKNIIANQWKPSNIQLKRYKMWHEHKIGKLDNNWNKFMDVQLYNLGDL